jgi:hypothetical protein
MLTVLVVPSHYLFFEFSIFYVNLPLPFDFLTYTAAGGQSLANKLRSLSSEGFVQLLSAIFRIVQVN